ncbi:MAG: hypothetical protein MRERC_1c122 [Mycoplasmataceae bacterium RC_NB112A]|nr:MAG: hypothetical protein MRERC_1c122 [Mycoplasmataceae bacterium RC_NB112A]
MLIRFRFFEKILLRLEKSVLSRSSSFRREKKFFYHS